MNRRKRIIGLMSGTSLDGLDICCADFWQETTGFAYEFVATGHMPYTAATRERIHAAYDASSTELISLGIDLTKLWSDAVLNFIQDHALQGSINFVGSHGQTIFHRPDLGYTVQIGDHLLMSHLLELPVYAEFRQADIILGGQGAPLVPIGDKLLLDQYDFHLNIGGFSNIGLYQKNLLQAYDVCPANLVLNHLSSQLGKPYDKDGQLAQSGQILPELLSRLNALDYYTQAAPKSLGREWTEAHIFPLLDAYTNIADMLCTYTEHVAIQVGRNLPQQGMGLVTGGGTNNAYLIERIRHHAPTDCTLDTSQTDLIEYKEALIFGFLAYLKHYNQPNVLSQITGASRDHSAGVLYNVSR